MTADRKPPREVRAWACVDDDGLIYFSSISRERRGTEKWATTGDRVIPVRIVLEVADE